MRGERALRGSSAKPGRPAVGTACGTVPGRGVQPARSSVLLLPGSFCP